ncbi:MAG: rRNA pseudouridine synthase [Calditrichaeota bacterium]|nr:MAG: rRNA pseudouridine synthase [Calditrichota bacterium]
MENLLRISKFLANQGICSRRKAEEFIAKGLVSVDGKIVTEQGVKINPETQKVKILEKAEQILQKQFTIILNKPVGYVSNLPLKGEIEAKRLITKKNSFDYTKKLNEILKNVKSFSVAGRLDKDSRGLLVLTQDGTVAKKIIGENSEIEKEYFVKVSGEITEEKIRRMSNGMRLKDIQLKPCRIHRTGKQTLRFILREGKNRQIRRMCQKVFLKVEDLERVRVGGIRLEALPEGKWKILENSELSSL